MARKRHAFVAVLVAGCLAPVRAQQPQALLGAPPFETYLDLLRQSAGIPGLSGVIVQNGEVAWERGFGFQNLEQRVRATPDTPYAIGDLTATLAATLVLQCVEEHRLDLDSSVRKYNVALPDTDTLRQVLSHTTVNAQADVFRYDADRFAQLGAAVEFCAPQPYRKTLAHRLLERLAMKDSVPGRDVVQPNAVPEGTYDDAAIERYARILERLAIPYKVDRKGRATRSELPAEAGLSASTGLISTVRDLAQFDAALDNGILLRTDTLQAAWTNVPSRDRTTAIPTGLGWFVQRYNDEPVVWHFGLVANGYSSMILKLPNRRLTLILLANSDGLTAPFQLATGDVTKSLFATLFLRLFVA
jgi:CubicO group peptidase (beta-lactamase class C family)